MSQAFNLLFTCHPYTMYMHVYMQIHMYNVILLLMRHNSVNVIEINDQITWIQILNRCILHDHIFTK